MGFAKKTSDYSKTAVQSIFPSKSKLKCSVGGLGGDKGVISALHLTCFCEPCLTGEGDCVNEGIVGSFYETTLIQAICRTTAAKA